MFWGFALGHGFGGPVSSSHGDAREVSKRPHFSNLSTTCFKFPPLALSGCAFVPKTDAPNVFDEKP